MLGDLLDRFATAEDAASESTGKPHGAARGLLSTGGSVTTTSEELARTSVAVEQLPEGEPLVLVADAEMRYLDANEAACRLLGYTREELLAMRVPDVCAES